jgi:hypothetical protein
MQNGSFASVGMFYDILPNTGILHVKIQLSVTAKSDRIRIRIRIRIGLTP